MANDINQIDTFKVISITHAEDIDGLGAQAILQRFFLNTNSKTSFKLPTEIKLIFNKPTYSDSFTYSFRNIRTDYEGIIPYWAAIFAENPEITDLQSISILIPEGFEDLNFVQKFVLILDFLLGNTHDSADLSNLIEKLGVPGKNEEILLTEFPFFFNYSLVPHVENILKFHEYWNNPELIIITDLGINKDHQSIFQILQHSSYNLAYLDHHEHFEEARTFLENYSSIYYVDRELCSTEIVKNIFLPQDPVSIKIAEYGMDSDYGLNKFPETDKIMAVIGKYYFDYDVTDKICNAFAQGDFYNDYIARLFNEVEIWEQNQQNLIKNSYKKATIKHNKFGEIIIYLGQSELRASRTNRFLDKYITETQNSQKNTIFISFQVNSGKANIRSKFFNVFKIAEIFGGGGHLERAGFSLPSKFLNNSGNADMSSRSNYNLNNINIEKFLNAISDSLEIQ